MSATEEASTNFPQKNRRLVVALIVVASFVGAAVAGLQLKRYADVWLRHPPRMPQCVLISQRLLSRPENVSGSIPHMAPDGNMVYLRPTEDRAIRCLSRVSTSTAGYFAAAFAETEPEKRARALAAILRDHVSTETSADNEALSAYLIASAAIRALPKSDEIDNLRKELQERNACRFDMRSQCPIRPPIPNVVWFLGIPSSMGVVVTFGWGVKAGLSKLVTWFKKRRAAKAQKEETKKTTDDSENQESDSNG